LHDEQSNPGGSIVKLAVVGVNHRTAPLEVLEQLAVVGTDIEGADKRLAARTGQAVVLHTCNRTEFYTIAEDTQHAEEVVAEFLEEKYGILYASLAPYVYSYFHTDAVNHLFRVTCSLDSMILGESEVLGQVREAFGAAVAAKSASTPITRVFHQALRVGKRARHETAIGQNARSVSYAFVELAKRTLGDITGAKALVIGAGEAGKLASVALRNVGVEHLTVMNRTPGRAVELAGELDGAYVLPMDDLQGALDDSDIVIACTGSLDYMITHEAVSHAVADRGDRPLFFLDVAVPRDVDPAIKDLESVFLADISDLDAIAAVNRQRREQEAERVEVIIEDEVRRFQLWWDALRIVPTLADLRRQSESLRERELARTLKRLQHLSPADHDIIASLSKSLVNKLLHNPVTRLKGEGNPADIQSLRWLFRLDGDLDGDVVDNSGDSLPEQA
jgi:glutamyl-tRNA reductase